MTCDAVASYVMYGADDPAKSIWQWMAIVFGHGLCGPGCNDTDTLERLYSRGFAITANQEQEENKKTPAC